MVYETKQDWFITATFGLKERSKIEKRQIAEEMEMEKDKVESMMVESETDLRQNWIWT